MQKKIGRKSPKKVFNIHLFGQINYESAKQVASQINEANEKKEFDSIKIIICSGGGDIYPSLALYDLIKNSKKEVKMLASGWCASAALTLLQLSEVRLCTKNTNFMVHPTWWKFEEKTPFPTFDQGAKQAEKIQNLFFELTTSRIKISKQEFEKLYNPIKFLTPEEAMKVGLIDEILE